MHRGATSHSIQNNRNVRPTSSVLHEKRVKYGTIFKLESYVKKSVLQNKRGLPNVWINLNTVRSGTIMDVFHFETR
jgi:hypothetical protein